MSAEGNNWSDEGGRYGVGIEYGSFTTCKLGQIVLILKSFNVCVCIYFQKFVES